ncbi:hypothetical protein MNV49_006606 [Pseudohyphozyma bogoriensis]|nr:hypothetical protein MNV49_006606 [Pseudohyphozyma bogoriensis]
MACVPYTVYSLSLHSHLLGSACMEGNITNVLPSAILCVAFWGVGAGIIFKWVKRGVTHQYTVLLLMAASMILTGFGFAIRAGLANTARNNQARSAVIAEQVFFLMGELLLIDSHVTLSRDLVKKWTVGDRSKWVLLNHFLLLISFIMSMISFVRLPSNPYDPPTLQNTQLRIAGSFFPFFLTLCNAIWLPFERVRSKGEAPGNGMAVLVLVAWFLTVPAFYSFIVSAVSNDTAPIVTSTIWFYLAFGLFQILAVLPFLATPIDWYYIGPFLLGAVASEAVLEGAMLEQEEALDSLAHSAEKEEMRELAHTPIFQDHHH